jgi:hypothetical protein
LAEFGLARKAGKFINSAQIWLSNNNYGLNAAEDREAILVRKQVLI